MAICTNTNHNHCELHPPEKGRAFIVRHCIDVLKANLIYKNTVLCEPQIRKRGLYPTVSTKESGLSVRHMMNVIAYADGTNDLGLPFEETASTAEKLKKPGLLFSINK